jgi:hypothetical protein
MEMMMVTQFFTWLFSAFMRKRVQKCASKMLQLDDRLLRDIGLTKSDVLNCMSKPDHKAEGCLPARHDADPEIPAAAAAAAASRAVSPADSLAA